MIVIPLLVSVQLVLAVDAVPQFDATRGCRTATADMMVNRSIEACRTDEDNAKKALSEGWTKFPTHDRATCKHMITMGGPPSYVELLTCLELAQQTKGFQHATGTATQP